MYAPSGNAKIKRWLAFLFYALTICMLIVYKSELLAWMQQGSHSVFLMLLITICFTFFPILPYSVVIGIMAFMYGTLPGALLCWTGAWISSLLMYAYTRFFYSEQTNKWLSANERIVSFHAKMKKNPFVSILLARLIPVLPQSIVSIYAGAASISFPVYALASAIGKIPGMLIYAFIGKHLLSLF
ncbi:VTT domain-containing protein [Cohnella nanjingensis]|uniref:TVP38/TMEM64 family membrane protein n=2 Tax=Cohnella nanjingensis TaxID=1387779 RepID=A0A7X0VEL1_9BACL|nr:VTT domain-containing protein [Cohnella nanjingensis]